MLFKVTYCSGHVIASTSSAALGWLENRGCYLRQERQSVVGMTPSLGHPSGIDIGLKRVRQCW